jgi:hypothetical protein
VAGYPRLGWSLIRLRGTGAAFGTARAVRQLHESAAALLGDECQHHICTQRQCARQLCSSCRSQGGNCHSTNCCFHELTAWWAAIGELQNEDNWIAQQWLEVARTETVTMEHRRRGLRPRLDDKPAKPHQSNTPANSQCDLARHQFDAQSCEPTIHSAGKQFPSLKLDTSSGTGLIDTRHGALHSHPLIGREPGGPASCTLAEWEGMQLDTLNMSSSVLAQIAPACNKL